MTKSKMRRLEDAETATMVSVITGGVLTMAEFAKLKKAGELKGGYLLVPTAISEEDWAAEVTEVTEYQQRLLADDKFGEN